MFEVEEKEETKTEELTEEVKKVIEVADIVREVFKVQKEGETKVAPAPQIGIIYNPASEKKVTIIIEEQEGDENTGDVFVEINGYAYQIRRGFEVDVPEGVVSILKNSIITKMFQNKLTDEITYKDVPRFNFRVIK